MNVFSNPLIYIYIVIFLGIGLFLFLKKDLIGEVLTEYSKVTWAKPEEVRDLTIVVFILTIILTTYIWLFDLVASRILLYLNALI